MRFPHFASIEGYANLEGQNDFRFFLKHFERYFFIISYNVILYETILKKLLYATLSG